MTPEAVRTFLIDFTLTYHAVLALVSIVLGLAVAAATQNLTYGSAGLVVAAVLLFAPILIGATP